MSHGSRRIGCRVERPSRSRCAMDSPRPHDVDLEPPMTTSPRKIGPLIPFVAVACIVVAAVVYDSWPTPEPSQISPPLETAHPMKFHRQHYLPLQPPLLPAYPTLTHEAADAAFDLQVAYLREVLGKDVPAALEADRALWVQALIAEYPTLSEITRSELAASPATLARFAYAWSQLNSADRSRIREEARASGAGTGPDAVLARYAADGLRAQMYRSSVRGWAGFLVHLRAVPLEVGKVPAIARVARVEVRASKDS